MLDGAAAPVSEKLSGDITPPDKDSELPSLPSPLSVNSPPTVAPPLTFSVLGSAGAPVAADVST